MVNIVQELSALVDDSAVHLGKMENISRQLHGLDTLILMKRDLARSRVKEALHAVNVRMASRAAAALLDVNQISKDREKKLAKERQNLNQVKTELLDVVALVEGLITTKDSVQIQKHGPRLIADLKKLMSLNLEGDHSHMTHLEFVVEELKDSFSLGYIRTTVLDPNNVKVTDIDGNPLTKTVVGRKEVIKMSTGKAPVDIVESCMSVDLYDPNEDPVELTVVETGDEFLLSFEATEEGVYQLEVRAYGFMMQGFPRTLVAVKPDTSPRKRQRRSMLSIAQQYIVESIPSVAREESRSDQTVPIEDNEMDQLNLGVSQLSTRCQHPPNPVSHDRVHSGAAGSAKVQQDQTSHRIYGPLARTLAKPPASASRCVDTKMSRPEKIPLQPPSMFQLSSKWDSEAVQDKSGTLPKKETCRPGPGREPLNGDPVCNNSFKKNINDFQIPTVGLHHTPVVIKPQDTGGDSPSWSVPSFPQRIAPYHFPVTGFFHSTGFRIKTEKETEVGIAPTSKDLSGMAESDETRRLQNMKGEAVRSKTDASVKMSGIQDVENEPIMTPAVPKSDGSKKMPRTQDIKGPPLESKTDRSEKMARIQNVKSPPVIAWTVSKTCGSKQTATIHEVKNRQTTAPVTLNTNGSKPSQSQGLPDDGIKPLSRENDTSVISTALSKSKPVLHAKMTVSFGKRGTQAGAMQFPIGLTTSSRVLSDILMCDTGNNMVKVFTSNGEWKKTIGVGTTFSRPSAVVTNDIGEIFVKDNHKIQKFSSSGDLIAKFGQCFLGQPYGLALTTEGKLLTLDHQIRDIVVFDQDGILLKRIPFQPLHQRRGPGRPRFRFLAVHGNSLVVVDLGQHEVVVMDLLTGKVRTTFGSYGTGPGQFNEPSGVTVDQCGNVLVADSRNNRVQVFDIDGNFKCYVNFNNEIRRPSDIHITKDGYLLVDNYIHHHIKVFKLQG